MGPIRAHRRVVGDPEAPWVDAPVAGHTCVGTTAYLVGVDGVPVRRVSGEPSGAQASVPLSDRSTPSAVARRAGPLASSLSFRAESRRLRASSAPSVTGRAVRAIVYARLGPTPRGEESKGGNLTQQVELSQALCDRNGWTVVEVITEKDSSASKFRVVEGRKVSARGEGWRRVVELVRTGTADVVVARHYDRLYRTTRDLVELVDLAEETGVHLAAAQAQGVLDLATPSGRLAARIGAAVAENETEMRLERQVLGHQRRRESGRPFWSTRPFGFERDGTHRDEEAEALRQAYRHVLAGVSLWSIAKDWTLASCSRRTARSGVARTSEELDYEDTDRIDYVRTVVMQVCELVELMSRGRGVRRFESDHCRITFRNP